ncbi:Pentatricopeptide repeat-containing protein mitochondrial [Zea mays]|uniref:Pentatricopeptide repeat-containing protein mitochondrial n=1 Tax=Zea mays TaxID=4577 RepID=A0A1D6G8P4_MAIZE|nr:Pentatricopeptide repeat-containing protein mitochondrial [Zea mays]
MNQKCGYAQNAKGEEALYAYRMMRATGLMPDNTTVLGLLFGCKHAGLVDEGNALFKTAGMEQPGILKAEHYACVVDLSLSHAKWFDDCKGFLEELLLESFGSWQGVSMIRREIKVKGLKRITGCSWIEVQDKEEHTRPDYTSVLHAGRMNNQISGFINAFAVAAIKVPPSIPTAKESA